MDYIFAVTVVLISIHGYTFGRWLGVKGNRLGMFGVFFLIIINLSLFMYQMIKVG